MMQLTFVGTGVSCAIPVIGHFTTSCACDEAIRKHDSPNRRNNVSLMITLTQKTSIHKDCKSDDKNEEEHGVRILIDAGKTFRDAYFRVLAPLHVRYVDALLLTHGHADAMQCVEQVCELHSETYHCMLEEEFNRESNGNKLQKATHSNDSNSDAIVSSTHHAMQVKWCLQCIPTYLTMPTLEELERISPEVVQSAVYCKESIDNIKNTNISALRIGDKDNAREMSTRTSLELHVLSETKPEKLHIAAVEQFMEEVSDAQIKETEGDVSNNNTNTCSNEFLFYSLPVEHGTNYISLGFVFSTGVAFRSAHASESSVAGRSCVVYISDVSTIIEPSMSFLRDLVKIDVLVIDCLAGKGRQSPPHTCWDDLMPIFRELAPAQVYCVGMFCSLEHHTSNTLWASDLQAEKLRVMEMEKTKSNEKSDHSYNESHRSEQPALRFVQRCEFIKLAYDSMQLDLPL